MISCDWFFKLANAPSSKDSSRPWLGLLICDKLWVRLVCSACRASFGFSLMMKLPELSKFYDAECPADE